MLSGNWVILAGLSLLIWTACENQEWAADDEANDQDDNDDPDDADLDTEACTLDQQWGSGFEVGEAVANWRLVGFWDKDGDGGIQDDEQESEVLSLEHIYCHGKKSIVIFVGDLA